MPDAVLEKVPPPLEVVHSAGEVLSENVQKAHLDWLADAGARQQDLHAAEVRVGQVRLKSTLRGLSSASVRNRNPELGDLGVSLGPITRSSDR